MPISKKDRSLEERPFDKRNSISLEGDIPYQEVIRRQGQIPRLTFSKKDNSLEERSLDKRIFIYLEGDTIPYQEVYPMIIGRRRYSKTSVRGEIRPKIGNFRYSSDICVVLPDLRNIRQIFVVCLTSRNIRQIFDSSSTTNEREACPPS